jgi:multiple sugar transport system ATP-binding protein
MASVRVDALHKSYGAVHAVRGVDLDIPDGEFTVLVGPSGCGKSTLLRTIAGLEEADSGDISIGGEIVNSMRPRDRDVAMVFQDYALYPHMTVYGNISLSLRARKMPKREIEERVKRATAMLGVARLLDRYPRQLSGGQRQRVAIGRAIVRNPSVFLFDEPLSNLDAQLRDEMRGEIKRLHQEISTTMIYVTHDQVEAMTLADRIVLLRDGVIEQQGSPLDLFERPASLFVAGFLGSPRMNFVRGELRRRAESASVRLGDGGPELAMPKERIPDAPNGGEVILGFRPEHVHRSTAASLADGHVRVASTIELVQPTGSRTYATFKLGGQQAIAELRAHEVNRAGEPIEVDINLTRAVLFDPATGRALRGSRP